MNRDTKELAIAYGGIAMFVLILAINIIIQWGKP